MTHLSSDLLRTFLAIDDAGSVTGGAERIGRSQSATSLQVRQLEDVVGKPLFQRHGRGVILTPAGETLRPVARKVVQSLDAALAELRGEGLRGKLRIGMPDDHERSVLTKIVSDFVALHPRVELEVRCAMGPGFEAALNSGALDLAVFEVPSPSVTQQVLQGNSLVWQGRADREFEAMDSLPVALFDEACWWRDLALSSLEEAGRRYHIAFTSESTIGVETAVTSGVAVGLLNSKQMAKGIEQIASLSAEYSTFLVLQRAGATKGAACDAMCTAIEKAFTR